MATPKRPLTDDEVLLQYARQQTGNNPTLSQQGMVTLGLNTAAGVPPVAPGYDTNPAIRNAQAAEDRAMQARATTLATGAYDPNPTVRSAQAAEDRAMQTRATAPLVTNTGLGAAADVPVTPDMARAARVGRQDPDVPMVSAPAVPAVAQVTPQQSPARAQAPAGAVRRFVPQGPGAATNTGVGANPDVPFEPTAATTTIGQGLNGAVSPEDQAVIAQDRANLKSAVDTLNKNFDTFRVPEPAAGPAYANQRGDYSMTGTSPDVIADAARRSYTGSGGVNFGFAPGEASARLAGYAAQDQATREATAQRRAAIQADVERIGLRNAMTQGTPQERRAARQQMEALDARMNLGTQQLGDTTRQRISTAGDIQRASLAAQASQAAAMADAQAKLEAAQLTGEYGLAAAREKAAGATQAELTKAASPQGVLAAQRAALIQQQMLLAQQAAAAGDVSGTYAAYGLSRPNEKVYTDPVTGAPLSAEQIAIIQQQQLQRLQQTQ